LTRFVKHIGVQICLLVVLSAGPENPVQGQSLRDTSLLTIYSRPYYYNVVKDWKGTIYTGTSEGIFRMNEASPEKVDNRKGYLKINDKGQAVIDSNGIKYHQQTDMSHLLPFPTVKRDEYHAAGDPYFYITSGGRLHVYEILPYSLTYRNISIRTISPNFTGTYSGIYFRNRLLPLPVSPFTDGYIREYNGKVFMCTHGLDIFDISELESGKPPRPMPLPKGFEFIPCKDIRYLPSTTTYVVASGNRIGLIDSSLSTIRQVFIGKKEDETTLLNEIPEYGLIYFSSGNRCYSLDSRTGNAQLTTELDEHILDGMSLSKQQILLTANALYVQKGNEPMKKKLDLRKAHTLCKIGENSFVISTDEGLMHYNLDENRLSTLIDGVEFNRRGLHLRDKKLFAGSVRGLYILDLANLDNIIAFNQKQLIDPQKPSLPLWTIAAFVAIVAGLLALNQQYRRRIRRMQDVIDAEIPAAVPVKPRLQREQIEKFIRENLHTASLKTITEHFQTNNSMVYTLLAPDKPGDLIQQLRYEKVAAMQKQGKTLQEIAYSTGLSISYIRRISKA
jgi:hypothetical protein